MRTQGGHNRVRQGPQGRHDGGLGPLEILLARLETSAEGLTTAEAERRLAAKGPNELTAPSMEATLWELIRAASGPLTSILIVAGVASAFLGELANSLIIFTIVVVSAGINLWQNHRSHRAVRQLQEQIAPTATVRRDGLWRELPRRGLVPGDIVRLAAGDLVPADLRILVARDLFVEQSSLTGESLPQEKGPGGGDPRVLTPDAPEFVFLGTSVVSGTADAVVLATGGDTAYGYIVGRLAARPEETPFERGMSRFGLLILKTVFVLVFSILLVNVTLGRDPLLSVLFSVALAVGLTPEFLPMMTTLTLAQGAIRMARENVIVKHLPAIQNLGSIDTLCSDKTGTLTSGDLSLAASLDPWGEASDLALRLGYVNAAFETGVKSPLDAAILKARQEDLRDLQKTDEIPFDFERRRVSVVVQEPGTFRLIAKGAPEAILEVSSTYEVEGQVRPLDPAAKGASLATFHRLSQKGYRVLGVAYRLVSEPVGHGIKDEREMTLVGFLTFVDEPLPGMTETLARLRDDGIRVMILTGDNEHVTRHVASQVGLNGDRITLGHEIDPLDDGALAALCEEVPVFARVSPAQKHRIIRALKSRGHVVGFLGDGINDAPSLHGADVGICAAFAVDIAREASDIILLERNLDVLHAGIVAGRRAYANVLKYLLMGTSSNFGNMFSMAGATLFLPFLPMLPTQILLNNFLYDMAQLSIPTDRIDDHFIKKPQKWDLRLIRNFMLVVGPVSSLYDFLTFFVMLKLWGWEESAFHTGWFLESLATQTLVLFVIRTVGRPWRHRPSGWLVATTLGAVVLGLILPWTSLAGPLGLRPLPSYYFVFLVLVVGTYLGVVEVVKAHFMRRFFASQDTQSRP